MKKFIAVFSMAIILMSVIPACADSGWEFRFFGINPKDFKDRSPVKVIIGGAASIIAHEVLGHLLVSEACGMGRGYMDFESMEARYGDGYDKASSGKQALAAASGMLVQDLGSIILTSIPVTRHSDFTVGWNTGTMFTGSLYAVTGGVHKDTSDVVQMNDRGWPGSEIAWGTGIIGGITTYISLDKYKN